VECGGIDAGRFGSVAAMRYENGVREQRRMRVGTGMEQYSSGFRSGRARAGLGALMV